MSTATPPHSNDHTVFYLRPPSPDKLDAICAERADAPFTFSPAGVTERDPLEPRPGFVIDRYGVVLGRGAQVYERAIQAVRDFAMYPPGWTRIHRPPGHREIRTGALFVTIVHHLGFCSALPCRLIYTFDSARDHGRSDGQSDDAAESPAADSPVVHRFGFALGTLPGHAECGEERFDVSWNSQTGQVRYDVLAISRPEAPLARLGAPFARLLQKRFARDSQANMLQVVNPVTRLESGRIESATEQLVP
ncbi:MAG: DUF1990 domain-containing protein [Myxococcota bacterium]